MSLYGSMGYEPTPTPPAFINPPKFKLKKKTNLDDATVVQDVQELEPGMEPEPEPPIYNPFRFAYRISLEELSMDVWVKFELDNANYKDKDDLIFKDSEGIEHRVPFFPRINPGTDPGQTGYNLHPFYLDGEQQLCIYPSIVKAESYGEKGRLQVTQDVVVLAVTPERMERALIDFYSQCRRDPDCPVGLLVLLKDMCQGMNTWSPEVEAAGMDQDPDLHSFIIDTMLQVRPTAPPTAQSDEDDVESDEWDDDDWDDEF